MPKYIIEGTVDFFTELYKSLDDNDDDKVEKENNLCLITNQPLIDNYVTMKCGHKFNYIPLFKDIYNHKKNFNNLESHSGKLCKNEIRCPYCRKKQTELLPYYENIGIHKVLGVNELYDETAKCNSSQYANQRCEYVTVENENNGEDIQHIKCNGFGTPICVTSYGTNYGDTKRYCWIHTKIMIQKYKKELIENAKNMKKQAKIEEKMKIKQLKEESKLKEKEEKMKIKLTKKENKKVHMNENVIIGTSIVEQKEGCVAILKYGINKGNCCGNKIYNNETNMCLRHNK
jgi:hypothetical protein